MKVFKSFMCFAAVFTFASLSAFYVSGAYFDYWSIQAINGEKKYAGGTSRVAIIDTGVALDNQYLDYSKIEQGKNYVFENSSTDDIIGHGTYIAGIIHGATTETGSLKGVCPSAVIVPLVFCSEFVSGVEKNGGVDAMVNAIYDAVDEFKCDVINLSTGISFDSTQLKAAIEYAEQKNVIVVSAVGNDYVKSPEKLYYPAAYDTVVGVGAVNSTLEVCGFSQRNQSVFVVAPGENISSLSIENGKDVDTIKGTSFATAYVTGLAALVKSNNCDITPDEFRRLLKEKSHDLGAFGYDTSYGYGLINVDAVMSEFVKTEATDDAQQKDGFLVNYTIVALSILATFQTIYIIYLKKK